MRPATPLSAAVAGLWAGLGGLIFEGWLRHSRPEQQTASTVFVAGSVVFFLLPWFAFVVGRSDDGIIRHMWRTAGRHLCWMAAVLVTLVPGYAVLRHLYAS
jgi:hypothetical protein